MRTRIPLANDFEDWKTGTHGWRFPEPREDDGAVIASNGSALAATPLDASLGWNTFNFSVIGSLELRQGFLLFDTDSGELSGDVVAHGVLATTRLGTPVAVFNFMTVFLGADVRVRFQSQRAAVILSRSSAIIDTELRVRPGTLGGFPGGGFIGSDVVSSSSPVPSNTRNLNNNGPGSTNVRVYVKTLSTSGSHVPEIQEIETSADSGQKMQGHFVITWRAPPSSTSSMDADSVASTQPIPYDSSAFDVKGYLETAFPEMGALHVERDDALEQTAEIGRLWRVTFLTAVGDVPPMRATSLLSGLGSQVTTRTVREGNQLSGFLRLGFLGSWTRWVRHNSTAEQIQAALLDDIPAIIDAIVTRTDQRAICHQGSTLPDQSAPSSIAVSEGDDSMNPSEWLLPQQLATTTSTIYGNDNGVYQHLCAGGRGVADGYIWKLQLWTRSGNVAVSNPTVMASNAPLPADPMQVDASKLEGLGATAQVVDSLCFSLAFGGAGASSPSSSLSLATTLSTGLGGAGYAGPSSIRDVDGAITSGVPDLLLGGSGGAGGGMEPMDVFPIVQPTIGGAGAGAITLAAVNDILIGASGKISVNGGDGSDGYAAGGGGAGGMLALASGGTIAHHGVLEALGGNGGRNAVAEGGTGGGGGGGGRIVIYAQSFSTWGDGDLRVDGGTSQDVTRSGRDGLTHVKTRSQLAVRVDPSLGAAGTNKSLLVHRSDSYYASYYRHSNDDIDTDMVAEATSGSSSGRHGQVARSGPRFVLNAPSRPTRISYFVRVGNLAHGEELLTSRGAIFGVVGSDEPIAAASASANSNNVANSKELMVAVGLVDECFVHEANTFRWPRACFHDKVGVDRWYKLDVIVDWQAKTYAILLNDVLKVAGASFRGEAVTGIRLDNLHAMSSWWDEIYVGEDFVGQFVCPRVKRPDTSDDADTEEGTNGDGVVVVKKRKLRKLWSESLQAPGATMFHPMVRHESHLSQREIFKHNDGGIAPLDGEPHREFFNDALEQESETFDGTSREELLAQDDEEVISLSELLTIDNLPLDSTIVAPLETGTDWCVFEPKDSSDISGEQTTGALYPSVYWFSEWFNSSANDELGDLGGIGACSTVDYSEWRNEGILLHFANLSDPFGERPCGLIADRPKVIFNTKSRKFVMWMHVDNSSNSMGLAGVAMSEFPNGPFQFQRSLYPDAPLEAPGGQNINETHDQTIALLPSSPSLTDPLASVTSAHVGDANADLTTQHQRAFLLRTYFKTVEYWLPRPIMDPLWQSVPSADGDGTTTDFGLSYHRAVHHVDYDDPTDIYLQRWRMEDAPWEVICCQQTNLSDCISYTQIPTADAPDICPSGRVKKRILGQSQIAATDASETAPLLASWYKDPEDDANSQFVAHSVPSHTPWGFQVYNIKTWRGNYFDALSTNISLFIFTQYAGAPRRREIERNTSIEYKFPNEEEPLDSPDAIIPTNDAALLDDMLGTLGVPLSVAFRAKYSTYDIAFIDLNDDGKITASEIAALKGMKASKEITADLATSILEDVAALKLEQIALLDPDDNGSITYSEFTAWLGVDPNLLFDQFDLDKGGYLDENELARLLRYRQVPRLDQAMALFDPSLDGRVFYRRFLAQLLATSDFMFDNYDFDGSETLSSNGIDLIVKDLNSNFANRSVLNALLTTSSSGRCVITKADYVAWFSATTSLVDGVRDQLKVDNAVHPTRQDQLTGPLHVVERRRAKYVAISELSDDYLSTAGLVREVEGDFEGREALLNYFAFAEQLFGLTDASDSTTNAQDLAPFREFLSPAMLHERASFWNGRHWEGRPSAPPLFTYGEQCLRIAGSTDGCLPCATSSPYASSVVREFQSLSSGDAVSSAKHGEPQKELDAYVKDFDQQVALPLQYQQRAQFGPQGLQPHMSPCFNQSQFFPCDAHKVLDGNVGDTLRDLRARQTAWHLAWDKHPNNAGSSSKVRADDDRQQRETRGPSFIERFPLRDREPIVGGHAVAGPVTELDSTQVFAPDQLGDILGGGR